jgi:transcriptional regulator with XRE-family HTH domain
MKVAEVGGVVRSYRKASGLSQKVLATRVGMSRATLNVLESGRAIEIGAGKLLALFDVLGIPFGVPTEIDRAGDDATIDRMLAGLADEDAKRAKRLPRRLLIEAFASGRVPIDYDRQLAAVLEDADEPAVLAVIRSASATAGLSAKDVWKNGRNLAKSVGCTRALWQHSS